MKQLLEKSMRVDYLIVPICDILKVKLYIFFTCRYLMRTNKKKLNSNI